MERASASSSLCKFCKRLDVRALLLAAKARGMPESGRTNAVYAYQNPHASVPKFLEHRPNVRSLREGASTCRLCQAIWDQFSRDAGPSQLTDAALSDDINTEIIYIGTEMWVEETQGLPTIAASQYRRDGSSRRLAWFEAFADRDRVPLDNADLLGRSVLASSSADACLAIAAGWLTNCISNHKQCKAYHIPNPPLPRRVVEISSQPDHQLTARLIDANEGHGSFVALSYCWGGPGVIEYNSETERTLRVGLAVRDLPLTLRDAMIVTYKLGISYIWIDCLCIKQDDKLDWGREAVRMQSVFRNATVTLRAACASKVTETLFPERPSAPSYCALPWHGSTEGTESIIYLRTAFEFARMTTRDSMLSKRGWTLEEDLLAPRTLTFDADQIWYDCAEGRIDEAGRHTSATERYNNKAHLQALYHESLYFKRATLLARRLRIPPIVPLYLPNYLWLQKSWRLLRKSNKDKKRYTLLVKVECFFQGFYLTPGGASLTYFDLWRAIVRQYTSRILTRSKDVLTALAGIAEAFHQTHGDEYVAGMWRSDLVRSMSWRRAAEHRRAKDDVLIDLPTAPERYFAPSWSWASIKGKMADFLGGQDIPFSNIAKVVSVHLEYADAGLFGQISGGHVVLRAPFAAIPSPLEEVRDGPMRLTRKRIQDSLSNNPSAAHEFSQQHRAYSDQQFAIIHLCSWRDEEDLISATGTLLLESCEDGSWRRLGCFPFSESGRSLKKTGHIPHADELEIAEIKAAKLRRRTIKIV